MRLFLQLIRKMTSAAHDGGTDEWLRDHHSIQDVRLITIDVQIHNKDSALRGPCNVRGIENIGRKNTWETKGFWPAVCWYAISPKIRFELICTANVANELYKWCKFVCMYLTYFTIRCSLLCVLICCLLN